MLIISYYEQLLSQIIVIIMDSVLDPCSNEKDVGFHGTHQISVVQAVI